MVSGDRNLELSGTYSKTPDLGNQDTLNVIPFSTASGVTTQHIALKTED